MGRRHHHVVSPITIRKQVHDRSSRYRERILRMPTHQGTVGIYASNLRVGRGSTEESAVLKTWTSYHTIPPARSGGRMELQEQKVHGDDQEHWNHHHVEFTGRQKIKCSRGKFMQANRSGSQKHTTRTKLALHLHRRRGRPRRNVAQPLSFGKEYQQLGR